MPGHAPSHPLSRRFRAFSRESEGSVTVFALCIFLMMLFVAGMAVDLMRFETRRTALQNSIDSAVLASASVNRSANCEDLIREFMSKRGYDADKVTADCDEDWIGTNDDGTGGTLVARNATASYDLAVDTFFMKLLGIDVLNGRSTGGAMEENIPIEISLVLDISGSMRWDEYGSSPSSLTADNRINDLKLAVEDFLKEVLDVTCDSSGKDCTQSEASRLISINIIPYAGNVNPGPELFSLIGGTEWHTWSHCKEVTDDDFDDADLPDDSSNQLPHFMYWAVNWTWMNWGFCPKDDAAILAMQNDFDTINDYVQGLKLHDGTATHIGMKYGLALLNPTSRDEVSALASAGIVDSDFASRPANWNDDVKKIIVLMTDGVTTAQFRPKYVDKNGTSREWDYSVVENGTTILAKIKNYMADGDSLSEAVDKLSADDSMRWSWFEPILDQYGSIDSELENNPAADVESFYPSSTVYKENGFEHSETHNNEHITAMCNEAKTPVYDTDGSKLRNTRVTVYTIAFLAPTSAQDLMRDCATTPSYFFNVQDTSISSAFNSIAAQINRLRLTQ